MWRSSLSGAPRSPLEVVRRVWWLAVLLLVVGAVAGVVVARSALTTKYTAESRVAVGSTDIRDLSVPGFPSAAQSLASDYARYVGGAQTAAAMKGVVPPAQIAQVKSISASPVPDSNVIRVEAVATTPAAAVAASNAAAAYVVKQVNAGAQSSDAAQVLTQYQAAQSKAVAAQQDQQEAQKALAALPSDAPSAAVASARAAVTDATVKADTFQVQSQALSSKYTTLAGQTQIPTGLSLVQHAVVTTDDSRSHEELGGVGGVAAVALLILLFAAWSGRANLTGPATPPRTPPGARAAELAEPGPDRAHPPAAPQGRVDEVLDDRVRTPEAPPPTARLRSGGAPLVRENRPLLRSGPPADLSARRDADETPSPPPLDGPSDEGARQ